MKRIETLVEDVYTLLEGKSPFDPAVIESFGPEIGKVLSSRLVEASGERVPILRLSSIGKPLRQIWYDMKGFKPEKLSGKTKLKFLFGDLTESVLLALVEAAGHIVERRQEEVSIDDVPGHLDVFIDGVLVDVKSTSSYGFQKFKTGSILEGDDDFHYVPQILSYKQATGADRCGFLAMDKSSGELHYLEVTGVSFDPNQKITDTRECLKSDTPPPRCYEDEPHQKSGNRKLSIGCSFCGHKFECWKDSNGGRGLRVFAYSGKPIFLTKTVREPSTFELNKKEEIN